MTTSKYKSRDVTGSSDTGAAALNKYRSIIDENDVITAATPHLKLYDKANEGTKQVIAEKLIVERQALHQVVQVMDNALDNTLTELAVAKQLNECYSSQINEYDKRMKAAGVIDKELIERFDSNGTPYVIHTPSDPEVADIKLQLIKNTYLELKKKKKNDINNENR